MRAHQSLQLPRILFLDRTPAFAFEVTGWPFRFLTGPHLFYRGSRDSWSSQHLFKLLLQIFRASSQQGSHVREFPYQLFESSLLGLDSGRLHRNRGSQSSKTWASSFKEIHVPVLRIPLWCEPPLPCYTGADWLSSTARKRLLLLWSASQTASLSFQDSLWCRPPLLIPFATRKREQILWSKHD